MIVFSHGSFSFEDLDGNSGLVVLVSGEDLRFFGGDERTSGDNVRHDTSYGFNT